MAKETLRNAFLICLTSTAAASAIGCKTEPVTITPATQSAATLPTMELSKPVATPATKPVAVVEPPLVPAAPVAPASPASPATVPTVPGTSPVAMEPRANPLFTLPPSKGPAPHKFRQLTLYRSGPSGDLEMQLTGDGIYRIRDHANGRSYAGDGKLTDAQINEWADGLKDWESLKDSYLPDPSAKDVDVIEIIYGGKKVAALAGNAETPKAFSDAFKRLLELHEQSKKEAAAAEPAKTEPAKTEPAKTEPVKPDSTKPEPAKEPEAPKAPETKAPETNAPEIKAPEIKAPEVKAPETPKSE